MRQAIEAGTSAGSPLMSEGFDVAPATSVERDEPAPVTPSTIVSNLGRGSSVIDVAHVFPVITGENQRVLEHEP